MRVVAKHDAQLLSNREHVNCPPVTPLERLRGTNLLAASEKEINNSLLPLPAVKVKIAKNLHGGDPQADEGDVKERPPCEEGQLGLAGLSAKWPPMTKTEYSGMPAPVLEL